MAGGRRYTLYVVVYGNVNISINKFKSNNGLSGKCAGCCSGDDGGGGCGVQVLYRISKTTLRIFYSHKHLRYQNDNYIDIFIVGVLVPPCKN